MKTYFVKKQWMAGLVIAFMLMGTALFVMAEEKKDEEAKGYLGVHIERMSLKDKKDLGITHGVLVSDVEKNSAAEKAGIEEDDIIQYFNDVKIKVPGNLTDAVRETKPGAKAKIKIVRVDKPMTLTATVGKYKPKKLLSWTTKNKDKNVFFFGDKEKKFDVFKVHEGAYLGVHMQKLNDDLATYFGVKADGGALVMSVSKESPAEKAGLKSGDVIVELEGKKISGPDDVAKTIQQKEKDEEVTIKIMRHKKSKTVKAKLAARKGFGNIQIFRDKHGDHEEVEILRSPNRMMRFKSHHPGKIIVETPEKGMHMEQHHVFIDGNEVFIKKFKHKECEKKECVKEDKKDLDKVKEKKKVKVKKVIRESYDI